ncbi:HNH endonuclease [Nocardiopsis composta]
MESIDPLVGLSEQDYLLLGGDFEQAAWVVDTALLLFFTPRPPRLLKSFGLDDFMGERAGAAMRPAVGEICENRRTISEIYGGNNTTGITPFADGVLAVFSDDNGPYADSRIPETNWIAYTGDGLSGDQIMARGNKSMELCQKERRALRYWHKLSDGRWSFETWAVVVQCRRRWGVDQDKKQRKEFVWILAPVSSPLPSLWPQSIIDALNEDDGVVQDDTLSAPPDGLNGTWEEGEVNVKEKYQKLSKIAREVALKREQKSRISAVERYFRSYISRRAVIERSRGCCENPDCLGHPTELTSTGMPILEVDHVRDLSLGGSDVPENMIALCPNCHALKTRGVNREILRKRLKGVAQDLHRSFSSP